MWPYKSKVLIAKNVMKQSSFLSEMMVHDDTFTKSRKNISLNHDFRLFAYAWVELSCLRSNEHKTLLVSISSFV